MLFTSQNILLDGKLLRETFVHKIQPNVNIFYYVKLILNILLSVTSYFMYFKLWFLMTAILYIYIGFILSVTSIYAY
jgi:hypothetical protein